MSIIERALQKAQAKARTGLATAEPSPAVTQSVLTVTGGSKTSERTTAVRETLQDPSQAVGAAADIDEDISNLTSRDLKPIVEIDFDRLREAGRMPSESLAGQVDDEIRRIKWPLLKAIEGGDDIRPARNNVILVTSALPSEGKTFTSLNLALSIVRDRERRVVLVDGDVAKPGLTPSLGLEGRLGLNDALEDMSCDISSVTYQTNVEGLFFVPAGTWNAHSPEFFAGSRMPQLMAALSKRIGRGVVIFDSPPLLATNEAQVATHMAGQVLIVVRAEQTEQQAVLDAISLVDKDVPVSAVLNRCASSLLSRYYGRYYYGSGYGYGHGYGHGRQPKQQPDPGKV